MVTPSAGPYLSKRPKNQRAPKKKKKNNRIYYIYTYIRGPCCFTLYTLHIAIHITIVKKRLRLRNNHAHTPPPPPLPVSPHPTPVFIPHNPPPPELWLLFYRNTYYYSYRPYVIHITTLILPYSVFFQKRAKKRGLNNIQP